MESEPSELGQLGRGAAMLFFPCFSFGGRQGHGLPSTSCIGEWGSCSTLLLQPSSCNCPWAPAAVWEARPYPVRLAICPRTERGACTPHHLQPGISTLRSGLADMGEGNGSDRGWFPGQIDSLPCQPVRASSWIWTRCTTKTMHANTNTGLPPINPGGSSGVSRFPQQSIRGEVGEDLEV